MLRIRICLLNDFFVFLFYIFMLDYKFIKKKIELLIFVLKIMDVWFFLKIKNKVFRLFWYNLFVLFYNN